MHNEVAVCVHCYCSYSYHSTFEIIASMMLCATILGWTHGTTLKMHAMLHAMLHD